jgi:dihydroorotase
LGDVLVRDERIVEIAANITTTEVSREIDATGLVLLPGVIDPQVHFREPGLEHKEDLTTASRACAKGGVTSFLEMPNTLPLTITQAALDDKLDRASQKSIVIEGWNLTGYLVYTIVNGNIVYEKGEIRSAIKGKALSFDQA